MSPKAATHTRVATRSNKGVLPSYKKPPVEEVVCGLRFEPLPELKVPHIGLLWEKFREDYPIFQHATPIGTDQGILIDEATGAPLPRIWFISADDNQLIQFQGDRFYFNWRHRSDEYPRYPTIIQKFGAAKRTLDNFLSQFQLGPLIPVEYDLTYVNHIPKGQGWETADDIQEIFVDFNWQRKKERFLPNPDSYAWQARFPLPNKQGWLSTKLNQGKTRTDGTHVLILEIAARGLPNDKSPEAMTKWFDLAHEWIVRGFTDLTTSEIQKSVWKREDARTS